MRDDLRRAALFTSGVAEMTWNRAEDFVKNWVQGTDPRREQTQTLVKDLMDWSAENRKEVIAVVRKEIEAQLGNVGLASRRDVERLERRVERLEEAMRSRAAAGAKKTSRRKTSAKATTRGTTRGKSTEPSRSRRGATG